MNATKPRPVNPMSLGRRMKPTQKHRPAVWECMLATVYAMNDAGEVRYFDYDWDAAVEWAGVREDGRDPRTFKNPFRCSVGRGATATTISAKRVVLWVRKA
jgi:hypothetical protein